MCEAVGEGAWPVDLVWRVGLRLGDWSWAVGLCPIDWGLVRDLGLV